MKQNRVLACDLGAVVLVVQAELIAYDEFNIAQTGTDAGLIT